MGKNRLNTLAGTSLVFVAALVAVVEDIGCGRYSCSLYGYEAGWLFLIRHNFWPMLFMGFVFPILWTVSALIWFSEMRFRERARQRICISCGYDLRASRLRCPECGEIQPFLAHANNGQWTPIPNGWSFGCMMLALALIAIIKFYAAR